MKMKISKASWMILAAGVFIIILAGLGITRSGQVNEYEALSSNLTLLSGRLNILQVGNLQTQIDEYKEQLRDAQEQTADARTKLEQTVISVDVAEKFYQIADFCEVVVKNLSTSTISPQNYKAVNCETTSLSASITGEKGNILKLVIALNNNFSTGFVRSAQFGFPGSENGTVGVQMIVYTRKVSQ
jgi:hypothetical protein